MRKRWLLGIPIVLVAAGAAVAYSWWMKPYELPAADSGISLEQYGMTFTNERSAHPHATAMSLTALKQSVTEFPDNMAYSNALRIEMASRGKHEDFIAFVDQLDDHSPRLQLQKALAYVDQLQNPDLGTASLGQLSSRSISAVSEILEDNPYDLLAHYARGLNNIYWPSGLQRTGKAIQDLAYCLAAAKQLESETASPLWPLIYIAYGDALVKDGRVKEGIEVWKDGAAQYPMDDVLGDLAGLNADAALNHVRDVRGIDAFQRPDPDISDLSILWSSL